LVIAGMVGWSRVSPSANTEKPPMISTAAAELPGIRPETPVISQDTAHRADRTRMTRVRRRPSMRCSTSSCRSTMVAVLAAKA
jgi:hypothetical protein